MPSRSYALDIIFHVDVPEGITEFAVRQSPIAVPDPSVTALILFGLFGLTRIRNLFGRP